MTSHVVIRKYQYALMKVCQYTNTKMNDCTGIFYAKEYKITNEDTYFYIKLSNDIMLYPTSYTILEKQEDGTMKPVDFQEVKS